MINGFNIHLEVALMIDYFFSGTRGKKKTPIWEIKIGVFLLQRRMKKLCVMWLTHKALEGVA